MCCIIKFLEPYLSSSQARIPKSKLSASSVYIRYSEGSAESCITEGNKGRREEILLLPAKWTALHFASGSEPK